MCTVAYCDATRQRVSDYHDWRACENMCTGTVQCRTKLRRRLWQSEFSKIHTIFRNTFNIQISKHGIYGALSELIHYYDTDIMNIEILPFLGHYSMCKAVLRPQNLRKLVSLLLTGVHTGEMHDASVKTVFSIYVSFFVKHISIPDKELFSETYVGCTPLYSV